MNRLTEKQYNSYIKNIDLLPKYLDQFTIVNGKKLKFSFRRSLKDICTILARIFHFIFSKDHNYYSTKNIKKFVAIGVTRVKIKEEFKKLKSLLKKLNQISDKNGTYAKGIQLIPPPDYLDQPLQIEGNNLKYGQKIIPSINRMTQFFVNYDFNEIDIILEGHHKKHNVKYTLDLVKKEKVNECVQLLLNQIKARQIFDHIPNSKVNLEVIDNDIYIDRGSWIEMYNSMEKMGLNLEQLIESLKTDIVDIINFYLEENA